MRMALRYEGLAVSSEKAERSGQGLRLRLDLASGRERSRMPLLGAHVSTSGGVDKAPGNGKSLGCEAIQVFTRNQMQWRARPLSKPETAAFRNGLKECGIRATVSHDSYLINLGSH